MSVDLAPLEGLKKALVNRIMRKAMRESAKPLLQAAQGNARSHKRTGHMARSIKLKLKTYKTGVVAIVGPRSDYKIALGTITRGPPQGTDPNVCTLGNLPLP